jgi:redox-sensitive bicupin YhaK (pirin superfamily)
VITVRRSGERGHFDHGWLDTRHTFSFADYRDPAHMGFRALRVVNEDRVKPGEGFGTHGHRDMEILSYVLSGALAHRDSTGGGGALRPGEVQRMSAGTGVRHSEFNASRDEEVHFLQIWLLPDRAGHEPSTSSGPTPRRSAGAGSGSLPRPTGRTAPPPSTRTPRVFATLLGGGERVEHAWGPGRHAWVQVARGAAQVNGVALSAGDGAAASDEGR